MGITIGDAIIYIRGDSSKLGSDLRGVESQTRGFFGNLGQGIQQGFGLAIGSAVLKGAGMAIGGLISMGKTALDQVASFERLEMSMTSLVARELSMASTVTHASTTMRAATLDEQLARQRLEEQIASQQQTLANLTKTQGASSLEAQKAAQTLNTLQQQYKGLGFAENDMIAVTTEWSERTLDMNDALAQAGPRAKELLNWIQQLAIKSPFSQEGVATALRTAMAYGFTSEQAQELTQNMIDFVSATGGTTDTMNSIALALGQVQAKGKLAGQEILQLINAGVPVYDILTKMGYSLDDVSAGLVSAEEFLAAFNETMESDFGGAAERQSQSWAGLLNTLSDLKNMALREFFGGIFEAAQPVVVLFTDWLQSGGLEAIKNWGDALGNFAENGLNKLTSAFIFFKETGDLANTLTILFGTEKAQEIMDFMAQFGPLKDAIVNLFTAFVESGPEAETAWANFWANAKTVAEENMPQIIGNVSTGVNELANWWRQHDTQVIAIVGGTFNVISTILGGGMTFLSGLVAGGLQALNGDWRGGWETVKESTRSFADQILGIMGTNSEEVSKSWEGTLNLMLIAWSEGSDLIVLEASLWIIDLLAEFETWATGMSDAGWALINGLTEGITGAWGEFSGWFLGLCTQLIADTLAAFGIHSPSQVFKDIGENIGEGLANGIEDTVPLVSEAMAEVMEGIFKQARGFSDLGNTAADLLKKSIIDPLTAQVTAIDDQLAALGDGNDFFTAVERTRLMEQRAALTGEIAEHEAKILEMQEKQSQLDFLSKQFDLLQLIQENGLNPDDILGGMELGINASLEGIIEAMSNAMQALIEQAQTELGIASPSKVFEGMGAQIMAGMATGLASGLALPVEVMSSMVPALTGAATGTSKQYNFSQTIVNNFPSDRSGQGFGTMRAMAGA